MASYIRYANEGAIRNKPLSGELEAALSFLPALGVTMEVFSGGQDAKGSGGARTGSTRHDDGHAADVFFYKDGRRLDWSNPDDLPVFQEIIRQARANGVTGVGAGDGYMQPGSMHIGFGNEAVWGAGGKGENAPEWLRSAYYGAKAGSVPSFGTSETSAENYASGNYLQTSPDERPPENTLSREPERPEMPRMNTLAEAYQMPTQQAAFGGFDPATNPFLSYLRGA